MYCKVYQYYILIDCCLSSSQQYFSYKDDELTLILNIPSRHINVVSTTLIQRLFSTSIQLSNPTKIQRLFNVDMWRWSNVIFQHPFNFQIQLKFNVLLGIQSFKHISWSGIHYNFVDKNDTWFTDNITRKSDKKMATMKMFLKTRPHSIKPDRGP
jgi:hypothetical protein